MKTLLQAILLLALASNLHFTAEQKQKIEVGIDEKLGQKIPTQLTFTDEYGKQILLKNILDKPTIFLFVYYECPGICTPLMTEVAEEINRVDLMPGQDYQIISVSIDSGETSELALKKKKNYLNLIKKEFPDDAWKFLTGNSKSILALTDAAGFYFKQEDEDFIHGGALIFVSSSGTISRYLLGTSFLPFDIKMAVIETAEGRVTPTISKMLKFCFSYDPEGRKYTANLSRIFGIGTFVIVVGLVLFLSFRPKKKKRLKNEEFT